MSTTKQYGKLSVEDLRVLLSFVPKLDKDFLEMNQLRDEKIAKIFPENSPMPTWCHFYEMPHTHHFAEVVTRLGAVEDLSTIFKSDNPVASLDSYIKNQDDDDDLEITPEQLPIFLQNVQALTYSMVFSLRCLMMYGLYINQLVAIAREGEVSQKLKDNALLKAIRIDPTVICCQTSIGRISRAVLMDDTLFLAGLKKAMFGKLDLNKNKTYQKIRYVLQILHETGAFDLNDKALKELFVHQLNLYSDSQLTSEKNLGELARNFKKQKSTI